MTEEELDALTWEDIVDRIGEQQVYQIVHNAIKADSTYHAYDENEGVTVYDPYDDYNPITPELLGEYLESKAYADVVAEREEWVAKGYMTPDGILGDVIEDLKEYVNNHDGYGYECWDNFVRYDLDGMMSDCRDGLAAALGIKHSYDLEEFDDDIKKLLREEIIFDTGLDRHISTATYNADIFLSMPAEAGSEYTATHHLFDQIWNRKVEDWDEGYISDFAAKSPLVWLAHTQGYELDDIAFETLHAEPSRFCAGAREAVRWIYWVSQLVVMAKLSLPDLLSLAVARDCQGIEGLPQYNLKVDPYVRNAPRVRCTVGLYDKGEGAGTIDEIELEEAVVFPSSMVAQLTTDEYLGKSAYDRSIYRTFEVSKHEAWPQGYASVTSEPPTNVNWKPMDAVNEYYRLRRARINADSQRVEESQAR